MNFSDYQVSSMQTANKLSEEEKLLFGALCLCGEAGELANKVKNIQWHGHKINEKEIISEIGDCLWYITFICDTLNVKLEDVASYNIHKLLARYPNGFSESDSITRDKEHANEH